MHLNESICSNCKYFEHDCAFEIDWDGACIENCNHPDNDIRKFFYEQTEEIKEIKSCKGFK